MKASTLWLAVAVGWTVLLGSLAQENCLYEYTQQPPNSLGCSLEGGLILQCNVTGPPRPRLKIVWFRDSMQLRNGSSEVTIQENSNTEGSVVSILTQENSEDNLGSYSCQLSVDGSTLQTLPSDPFQLTDTNLNLGGTQCPQFKQERKCALNITVLPTSSVATTYTSQLTMTPTTQTLMMSLPSLNTSPLHTPSPTEEPSTFQATSSYMVTDSSTNTGGGSTTLQVWLYVVVAIAAVFAMIIIILVILCVGLCLRKSKTADMETQKGQDQRLHEQFSTIGTSAVSNGLDQRHPDTKGGFTTTTQLTNHSQSITVPETSDYNILGERDYEVINIVHSQPPEYHHLQRPSMQRSRAATYGFSSTGNGIRDMRSMTSVTSPSAHAATQEFMRGDSTAAPLPPPPKEGKKAVYPHRNRNFVGEQGENMAVHNRIVRPSVENNHFLERDDSTAQLLPNSSIRSRTSYQTPDTLESDVHESLYSPAVGTSANNPVFHHALENIPETGTMFPEPSYPSAFPVHEYDYVPTVLSHYETPVPSKKGTSSFPSATFATTLSSEYAEGFATGNTTAGFASSTLSSDYPKSSIADFTGSDTADFTGGSTPDCTTDSTTDIAAGLATRTSNRNVNGDSTSNVPVMTEFAASTGTSKTLPVFPNAASVDGHDNLTVKSSTINPTFIARESNGAVDNSTCTETSDFSGPIIFPHMLHRETTRNRNHYKKLDPATMEPVLKYAKINVAQKTDV